jgi:alpha-mannosidase
MEQTTIHIICNAHIDPVWLWTLEAGVDEVLATCAAACDLLNRNPDVVFTRGEAWAYEVIERLDPRLFQRIRRHVARGQWSVVGGWYLQPDCNLPGAEGFRKQIELGRDYFRSRFGRFPRVAYNVDSFGHTHALPDLMAEAGQTAYVMMRPQEYEKKLPARLFRWRGRPGGPAITTFRIAGAYNTSRGPSLDHLRLSLRGLPKGIRHTMCFVGVGDHGGGPSQELVDWIRAHRDALPGARLVFSSPERFFRAVARDVSRLPVVTGELQHHAVGCYSVHREGKVALRRAEHALVEAGHALSLEPALKKRHAARLREAWARLCFNQFHDLAGGTCLPSAYPLMRDQLGHALAVAEDACVEASRVRAGRLAPDPLQRLVVVNQSGVHFDDWIEHEPWLDWMAWQPDQVLLDENDRVVPHQVLETESATWGTSPRLLFRFASKPGQIRVFRIGRGHPVQGGPIRLRASHTNGSLSARLGGVSFSLPTLELVEDRTDTWSHGVDRFDGRVVGRAVWGRPRQVDSGPLMAAWSADGRVGRSPASIELRAYRDEAFLEVRLKVNWIETWRLLRLRWAQPSRIRFCRDGGSAGALRRPSDGAERPVHDYTTLALENGTVAAAVFPEVFSISSHGRSLHLTLLRSAVMAHHDPHDGVKERGTVSDRGEHRFLVRLYPSRAPGPVDLAQAAAGLHRAPRVVELTRGMPARPARPWQ